MKDLLNKRYLIQSYYLTKFKHLYLYYSFIKFRVKIKIPTVSLLSQFATGFSYCMILVQCICEDWAFGPISTEAHFVTETTYDNCSIKKYQLSFS